MNDKLLEAYKDIIIKLINDYMLVNHEYITIKDYLHQVGFTEYELSLLGEIIENIKKYN